MADEPSLYVTYEGGSYGVLQGNLDGSNMVDLSGVKNQVMPNGIAIDSQHGKMYLVCTMPTAICSANLDGSSLTTLIGSFVRQISMVLP